MEIKTIDDLINAMQADIDQDEFCASDSYRVTKHWLNQLKRIHRIMEAKQSKDRELLIEMRDHPVTELWASTWSYHYQNKIRKHLEENP